ncbi:unnamed protein product, partial [Allacma fusca]
NVSHSSSVQAISGFPCFNCAYLICQFGIIAIIRLLATGRKPFNKFDSYIHLIIMTTYVCID